MGFGMKTDIRYCLISVFIGLCSGASAMVAPSAAGAEEIEVELAISETETAQLKGSLVAVRLEPFPDEPAVPTLFVDLRSGLVDYRDPRLVVVRVRFNFEACKEAIEKAESDETIELPPSFPVVLVQEQYRSLVLFEVKETTAFTVLKGPSCTPSRRELPFAYVKETGR